MEQEIQREKYIGEIKEIDILIENLQNKRKHIQIKMNNIYNKKSDVIRKVFIRACPEEKCRGFLSSQWKCGLCENFTCSECHVVKGLNRDSQHICNPDDLATAKLLEKDTKSSNKKETKK